MTGTRSRLRIIAGDWRGRLLAVPSEKGLRPTAERVRETLFNWLGRDVVGAECLDLFAGSGALGLEAASRGASAVVCVERSRRAAAVLRASVAELGAQDRIAVRQTGARRFLRGEPRGFDLVFLDPPFSSSIIGFVCAGLEQGGWLAADARIYVETSREAVPSPPACWTLWRRGTAGGVAYRLYQRETGERA